MVTVAIQITDSKFKKKFLFDIIKINRWAYDLLKQGVWKKSDFRASFFQGAGVLASLNTGIKRAIYPMIR